MLAVTVGIILSLSLFLALSSSLLFSLRAARALVLVSEAACVWVCYSLSRSLHGLLGWLVGGLFCLLLLLLVSLNRNWEIFNEKNLAQLGGVGGGGGCLRSSDVYAKSRGFAFLFVYLFFASPRRIARDFCYVCKCVFESVFACVWWYSFVYLRIGYFALNGVLFCFVFFSWRVNCCFLPFCFQFCMFR